MTIVKVSYKNLLKEAISDFTDVPKTVDVKGPFLDGIMKWDGGGELNTHQDAASILERYYFNENKPGDIEVASEGESSGDSMKNTTGVGTDQAGTSVADSIDGAKKEKEKDIVEDMMNELNEPDDDNKDSEDKTDKIDDKDEKEITEEIENAVIEKLIAEMETEDDEDDEDKKSKDDEDKEVKEGVDSKMKAPKEKKSTNPEEDTTGAGTSQAGTGTSDKLVPNRKDSTNEQEEIKDTDKDTDKEEEEEEEELDIDTKVKEDAGVGGGPIKAKGAMENPGEGEDPDDIEEAFQIFKEQLEDDDDEIDNIDADDIKV